MGMLRQKNAFRVAVGLHGEGCDWPMVGSLEVARGPISDDTQTKGPGGVVTAAEDYSASGAARPPSVELHSSRRHDLEKNLGRSRTAPMQAMPGHLGPSANR